MELNNPSQILWCNVCDKTQHEVTYLVASDRINICSECVIWCNKLISKKMLDESKPIVAANDDYFDEFTFTKTGDYSI